MLILLALLLLARADAASLKLLAKENFDPIIDVKGDKAGGTSGIAFEPKSGDWLLVSDDKGEYGPARFFRANVTWSETKLQLEWKRMVPLLEAGKKSFKKHSLDTEAIVSLPNSIVISSEGVPGRVMEFSSEGVYQKDWPLPKNYREGLRKNQGLEALCAAPDHDWVLAIPEGPLYQDGVLPKRPTQKFTLRAQFWREKDGAYNLGDQLIYPLETPADFGADAKEYSWGPVECLALSNTDALVLERGFAQKGFSVKTAARLFKITWSEKKEAKKELLLDFASIEDDSFSLDNIEAMQWGPKRADGGKTLLFMSDSNFIAFQKTQILLFSFE